MTTLLASALLAVAPFQTNQTIPRFSLSASDGLTYDQQSLTKKPTLVVFLSATCPHTAMAAVDLIRLKSELGNQVALVAFTNADRTEARNLSRKHKFNFPVIADESASTMEKFGARHSLDIVLIDEKSKRIVKFWEGYSRKIVGEISKELEDRSGRRIKFDLNAYPESRMSGCGF